MVRRHESSDEEWGSLQGLLPHAQTPGRYYRSHRTILDGMLYWLHTGVPWRDLPPRYAPWQTVYSRFRRWSREGLWDRVLARLWRQLDRTGQIDWRLSCVDGSNARAHKAAAGGHLT